MKKQVYIDSKKPENPGLRFDWLRDAGIEFLTGINEEWTDFNEHDPGLTMLEQFCYALTEMSYRAKLPIQYFLPNPENGKINKVKQVIYAPFEAFTSHPVTINDYRKLIYDRIEHVINVTLETSSNGHYNIIIYYNTNEDVQGVKSKIYSLLNQNRNLCEHFSKNDIQVIILPENTDSSPAQSGEPGEEAYQIIPWQIDVLIEINNKELPEAILANIRHKMEQYSMPGLRYESFQSMKNQGYSLSEIFEGPFLKQGFITNFKKRIISKPIKEEIISQIMEIDGVELVNQLDIKPFELSQPEEKSPNVPRKVYVFIGDGITKLVRIRKNGIKFEGLDPRRVESIYRKEVNRYYRLYDTFADLDLLDIKSGPMVDLGDYYSIQHHFPHIYALGKHGVSEYESSKRKAETKQLKGYLMLMEQFMANYMAQLQYTRELYSINSLKNTYSSRDLDDVPHVKDLYMQDLTDLQKGQPGDYQNGIPWVDGQIDNFFERRHRFLNYLSAVYGEEFTQYSLSRFPFKEYDQTNLENEDDIEIENADYTDRFLLKSKIVFLQNIIALGRDRSKAVNYLEDYTHPGNTSGLAARTRALLGINDPMQNKWLYNQYGLIDPEREAFHIVEHSLLAHLQSITIEELGPQLEIGLEIIEQVQVHPFDFRVTIVIPSWPERFKDGNFIDVFKSTVLHNCPAHIIPEFLVLNKEEMRFFESIYREVLETLKTTDDRDLVLDIQMIQIMINPENIFNQYSSEAVEQENIREEQEYDHGEYKNGEEEPEGDIEE